MSTLETQYKNYLQSNPHSEFTFDEWKQWHGDKIGEAMAKSNLHAVVEDARKQRDWEQENQDIVDMELWDHYSELPNPMWYEYKQQQNKK